MNLQFFLKIDDIQIATNFVCVIIMNSDVFASAFYSLKDLSKI